MALEHTSVVNRSPSQTHDPADRLRRLQAVTDVALADPSLDDVLGVLHVGTLTPREFSPADVELLEIVAQRVAVAIERSIAHEQLVRLTLLQRDFIALAAHELRTPAATVYGLAATLARRELP